MNPSAPTPIPEATSLVSTQKLVLLLDSAQCTKELVEASAKRRKGKLTKWEKKLLAVAEKALAAS